MKVCDACGCSDAKHQEVGSVGVEVKGYHVEHHTHRGKPWHWTLDLCPKCEGQLKDELDAVIRTFKEGGS